MAAGRTLLVTGATGTLGRAFGRISEARGLPHRLTTRGELDIAGHASVEAALDRLHPWAVINTAGYVRVDDAEREPDACARENTTGPAVLAAVCAERGISLVTYSSDLVFDGEKDTPYVESDPVAPLNVYGKTKAAAEAAVLAAHPAALVIRTSAFFGPWDRYNFAHAVIGELSAGRPFIAAADGVVSPTYVPDLVNASLDLLIDGERGLWHLANPGTVSWASFAREVAHHAGLDPALVEERPTASFGWPAPRPAYTVLGSERGVLLRPLADALDRFMAERESLDG